MDKESKRILAVISILLALFVLLGIILSGLDISGIKIHSGIHFT